MRVAVVCVALLSFCENALAQKKLDAMNFLEGPEFVSEVVAVTDWWSNDRSCSVATSARMFITDQVGEVRPVMWERIAAYDMSTDELVTDIGDVTEAYLDQVNAFSMEESCDIDISELEEVPIEQLGFSVDTGSLLIDGRRQEAEIYIDGDRLGFIKSRFILSAGTHTWKTMNCDETVEIEPNTRVERYCNFE